MLILQNGMYSIKGGCVLVTHIHCKFLQGRWHITDIEHCSQAHCDGRTCHINFEDLSLEKAPPVSDAELQAINEKDLIKSAIGIKEVSERAAHTAYCHHF